LLPCFIAQVEPTDAYRNSDHDRDRQPIPEPAVGSHAPCHIAPLYPTVGFYQLACNFLNTFQAMPENQETSR
jgi:hypothetical protein